MPRWLVILPLLIGLPCAAATVYKSVDARGRITFSDAPPAQAVSVDRLVVNVQAAADPGLYLARMAAMTELTDKLAAARDRREQARLASRRGRENNNAQGVALVQQGYYGGYAGAPRRHFRGHRYPVQPVAYPPSAVIPGPALVNQYPANLVRRAYGPHVAAVFRNSPVPGSR